MQAPKAMATTRGAVRSGRLGYSAFAALAAALAVVGFLFAGSSGAQISAPRGRFLTVPEYYEDAIQGRVLTNQLKARLTMREVQYLPGRVLFGRANQLEQYTPEGRTNVVARAPECFFNETNRLAWSTGQLEIIALDGKFLLRGRDGFQISLTNTVLTVSNRVRTVLKQNLLTP